MMVDKKNVDFSDNFLYKHSISFKISQNPIVYQNSACKVSWHYL